jgi:MFS family permease
LAAYILGKFAFPHSYGVLFMLVGVFTMVSYGFLLYMKEEDWVRQTEKEPLMNYIKKLGKILKEDKTFFYFMCALGIAILGSAGANFRIVYAKNVLGITARDVQVLTSVWIFSRAISSIGWGFVNDWKGYRFTMIAAHVIFFPSYILMNYLTGFGMLCIIFILHGIAESAIWVTQGNFIIQLGGEKNRATYLGLSSILFTPISAIGPLLMGGIIDLVNYQAAFLLSGVLMLVMVVITYKKVHVAKVI